MTLNTCQACREFCAALIEAMIPERKHPGERVALAIAAAAVRRGRYLTDAEKLENLARFMEEEDEETGTSEFAETARIIRGAAARSA